MATIQDIRALESRITDIVDDYLQQVYNEDDVLAVGRRSGKITLVDASAPSSTIRQHEFQGTRIPNTKYNRTNSWSHQIPSSVTNIRANAWNARYYQGNGNIVVQRLVHLSKLRASALS